MKRYGILLSAVILYCFGLALQHTQIYASLAVFVVAYLLVGYGVLKAAFSSMLKRQVFNEYLLMSLATFGAFFLGEYPEAVAVMLFYNIGELFEDYAVGKSRKSIAEIMAIRPEMATVKRDGELVEVDPDDVLIDDIIVVRAGERIPLDGIVIKGSANIDTSALTGESLPRVISENEEILSGSLNMDALLEIRVTKLFEDSTISRILDMVEMAAMRKSKREQFITKFAKYYTPVVVIGAVLLAIVPNFFTGFTMWQDWLYRSLVFLVVSCPCALVVSVPLSFFGGIGGASKKGILVKGSNYLEVLADIDTIVFDKTGTITTGVLEVSEVLAKNVSKERLLDLMCAIEAHSTHPLARAVVSYHSSQLTEEITNISEIGGRGLTGYLDGKIILCGNAFLMQENHIDFSDNHDDTSIHLAYDGNYYGVVTFQDTLKEEAKSALRKLKKLGVKQTVMLTGDKTSVAQKYQTLLGLDKVYGDLLPTDKLSHVETLLKEKNGKGHLAFVGDGINDAPVLARADLGVAMGAIGSDAAVEASDVVIMDDNLSRLAEGIEIARKTVLIAKENTFFAIGIKIGVLLLSVFGLANLWLGVFADVGVTVLAVLNALRSLYTK